MHMKNENDMRDKEIDSTQKFKLEFVNEPAVMSIYLPSVLRQNIHTRCLADYFLLLALSTREPNPSTRGTP